MQLLNDYLMVSSEIVSSYPSIDTQDFINMINSIIDHKDSISLAMKSTLKSGFNLIIINNIFSSNDKFYIQTSGASMGLTISDQLAEFALRPFGT